MSGNDSYTKLLIHSDGTNGSTTFEDSSASSHAVTSAGVSRPAAAHDTSQKEFLASSIRFYGTGNTAGSRLDTNYTATDWYFGAGEFTIDLWLRFSSIPGFGGIATTEINDDGWQFYYDHSNSYLVFANGGGSINSDSWSPSMDTWYHVAVVRSGNTLTFYIDGTAHGGYGNVSAALGTIDNQGNDVQIGTASRGGGATGYGFLNGWMDELRISKGIARWTSNFTPPDMPYGYGKLSGSLSQSTRLIVVNEDDWSVEHNEVHSAGNFELVVPEGTKLLAGRLNGGQGAGFGNLNTTE